MIPIDIMDTIIKGREYYKEYTTKYKRQKGVTQYIQSKFEEKGRSYKANYIRLICHYGKILEKSGYIEPARNDNWDAKKVEDMVRMVKRKEMPNYNELMEESQKKVYNTTIQH